jgi:hypothetical protein
MPSQPGSQAVWLGWCTLENITSKAMAMKIRLVGVGLVALGIVFALLFVYLPIRDGSDGFMGPVRIKALVFIPLAVVTGLAFVVGGTPALEAFQARPKSRGQLALVLSIIVGSGGLSGVGYWQIKTRWLRAPEQVILDASPKVPVLPTRQIPSGFKLARDTTARDTTPAVPQGSREPHQ